MGVDYNKMDIQDLIIEAKHRVPRTYRKNIKTIIDFDIRTKGITEKYLRKTIVKWLNTEL